MSNTGIRSEIASHWTKKRAYGKKLIFSGNFSKIHSTLDFLDKIQGPEIVKHTPGQLQELK